MTTMIRKVALGVVAATTLLTPALAMSPSASAATPYYLTGGTGMSLQQCNINKAAAERQANSGGNHIVWIGQTGCKKVNWAGGVQWSTGQILYSATHMTTKYDQFMGWDKNAALAKARLYQSRI